MQYSIFRSGLVGTCWDLHVCSVCQSRDYHTKSILQLDFILRLKKYWKLMINLLNSYLEIVKVGEIIIRTDLAISSLISDSPTSLQIAACRSVWNRGESNSLDSVPPAKTFGSAWSWPIEAMTERNITFFVLIWVRALLAALEAPLSLAWR